MDNLPVLKKCCFCMPLRYGLLTWGYLKLISGLLLLTISSLLVFELWNYVEDGWEIIIVILFAQLISEIIIHFIFIVGAHMKNVKILKVYYYYAIFIWILTLMAAFVTTALLIAYLIGISTDLWTSLLLGEILSYLFYIIIQTFLLLALRSEIIKLRSNCPYRFVKNPDDTEGTLKYEEETSSDDKEPKLISEKQIS